MPCWGFKEIINVHQQGFGKASQGVAFEPNFAKVKFTLRRLGDRPSRLREELEKKYCMLQKLVGIRLLQVKEGFLEKVNSKLRVKEQIR